MGGWQRFGRGASFVALVIALTVAVEGCGGTDGAGTNSGSSDSTTTGNTTTGNTTTGSTATGSTAGSSTTTTAATWDIATGAWSPDSADTSCYLELSIALDTLTATSGSSRLVVGTASGGVTPVTLDGTAAITLSRDSYGLTIRSSLSGDMHVAYRLTGSATTSITIYSSNAYKLVLDNATIASTDGPALNLQSKQTAFVTLSGSNTLSDSSTWSARTGDDGGTIAVTTTDDAPNAGSGIVIAGGRVYAASSANDAIDSNGTLTISGGIVVASGAAAPEGAFDADENTFAIKGGILAGLGGRNSNVTASASRRTSCRRAT